MPIYEYECSVHGIQEVWQHITDEPFESCWQASSMPCARDVKRLISRTAGHVLEPRGKYDIAPGLDRHGRQNERKLSPREWARKDDQLRAEMMETRARGLKTARLEPEG
jgi:putative FmdB family regulatory protein